MFALLGLAMVYSWVHAIIIVANKTSDTTKYEKFILIASLVMIVFYIIGSLS